MCIIFIKLRSDYDDLIKENESIEEKSKLKEKEFHHLTESVKSKARQDSKRLEVEVEDLKYKLETKLSDLNSVKKELSQIKVKYGDLKNINRSLEIEIEKLSDNNALKVLEEQIGTVSFFT